MEIYVKKVFRFPYFLFFLVFNHNFMMYIDFTRIAALNTAIEDVTQAYS